MLFTILPAAVIALAAMASPPEPRSEEIRKVPAPPRQMEAAAPRPHRSPVLLAAASLGKHPRATPES